MRHQELAHAEAEHGVTEELEALVVGGERLVCEARMRERLFEARNLALADDGLDACLEHGTRLSELLLFHDWTTSGVWVV